jgi:hypothetical protein
LIGADRSSANVRGSALVAPVYSREAAPQSSEPYLAVFAPKYRTGMTFAYSSFVVFKLLMW